VPTSMPDPESDGLQNHRMTVAYDGRHFFGWQRNGEQSTVQLALERAITDCLGLRVVVRGSGRTDRGAHAEGQVASVRLPRDSDPAATMKMLNEALAQEIRVRDLRAVDDEFHARDSALAKQYRYVLWTGAQLPPDEGGRVWHRPGRLNVESMREACALLVGEHDFASFATRPNFKQKSTRRTVSHATVEEEGSRIVFQIRADGFLYKMVRNIVRSLVKVGEGRLAAADLHTVLEARDRKAAPGTAPASGLYLDRVFYPGDDIDGARFGS
jgi:tRNA pseudouridine38-40 synthase